MRKLVPAVTAAVLALGPATGALAAQGAETQSLNELRNTVINLLQALVQRGVITKEQAEAMVKAAEDKAKKGLSTPEWVRRVRLSGDIRVRGEGDVFASGNVVNTYPYLNWVAI